MVPFTHVPLIYTLSVIGKMPMPSTDLLLDHPYATQSGIRLQSMFTGVSG